MGSRLKEDEKNERIIRGLLKQTSNRKCINCNVLGPQYVCTTFSTFVCTTCSGIHREFTHRVKSISMAKFSPQEIASLQAGGNERARELYFKEWDPQRHSAPDSSNVYKLRDFIKHVYVDRRYAGERSSSRPPQVKLGDKEAPSESRRSDGNRSGSRSPPYDDLRASPGYDLRRSPGYDQDNQRLSDYGRSPVQSGVVNDWRREDRFANGRKSEDNRSSDGESRSELRSPDHQKDSTMSSPPVVRPVRDILEDNVMPLRISEPPITNGGRVSGGPTLTQRTVSSSSLASTNSNPTELKRETSLIDFDAEPEPPLAAAIQVQQSTASQSVTQPESAPSDDNWACFDNFSLNKMSQPPVNANSVLTPLSVPAPAPISVAPGSSAAPTPLNDLFSLSTSSDVLVASVGNNAAAAAFAGATAAPSPATTLSSLPSGHAATAPGPSSMLPSNGDTGQWSGMQHNQQPFLHGAANQLTAQPLPSSFSNGLNNQGLAGDPNAQTSQVDMKSSGRKELPVDLFTATYSSIPYQAPGWQAGLAPGMGYHMHYNPAMAMPIFSQPSKSANPFDVNSEASSVQAAAFPSMSSLHSALPPSAAPSGLAPAPNVGNAMPSWMPPQPSSYLSTAPPLAQTFGSSMPGAYMGQHIPNDIAPPRPDVLGGFSNEMAAFGSLNPAAATPNPSVGGNPFG